MNKVLKLACLASISGLSLSVANAAYADPGHEHGGRREMQAPYYPGPNNSRIPYQTGYYQDSRNQRQQYTYPQDWKNYNRPHSWYQSHPSWHTFDHPDWYRRDARH